MLEINEDQLKVFEQLQFQQLKESIAETLFAEVEEWDQYDLNKQTHLVDYLFSKAQKARMIFDSEYILFSLLCMSSNETCRNFLKKMK